MRTLEDICNILETELLQSGIDKFNSDDIRAIINQRNFLLDEFAMDWINWELIDNEEPNEEEELFRTEAYEFIRLSCSELGIDVEFSELNTIFLCEYDMLHYVGNVKGYYQMLDDYPDVDFKREFLISQWTEWKDNIDEAVDEYTSEFGVYPNILVANNHTLSQFNFLVNNVPGEKEDIFSYDEITQQEIPIDKDEEVELSGYECGECHLHFAVNKELKDKEFILDFSEDIDDGDDDDDNDNDDDFTPVSPTPVFEKAF